MSPPGRPKGEYRSAQHEGTPNSPPGRPKGEYRSAQHEGTPNSPPQDSGQAPARNPLRWTVRLLGAIEAVGPTQTLSHWPTRAVACLLARLALAPDRAHPREELVELLWPGVQIDAGRNRLRQALSSLKSLLEPPGSTTAVLLADRMTVRVLPGALECDAVRFDFPPTSRPCWIAAHAPPMATASQAAPGDRASAASTPSRPLRWLPSASSAMTRASILSSSAPCCVSVTSIRASASPIAAKRCPPWSSVAARASCDTIMPADPAVRRGTQG